METLAQAKVAASALEAHRLGFLTEKDTIVMNLDHLLAAAKRTVLDLADQYQPLKRGKDSYAAGKPMLAALESGIQQLQWGGHATEYNGVVARQIAFVLCGGALSAPQWVTEEYILTLEQEAFLSLLHNQQTLERIQAMLKTTKSLRNYTSKGNKLRFFKAINAQFMASGSIEGEQVMNEAVIVAGEGICRFASVQNRECKRLLHRPAFSLHAPLPPRHAQEILCKPLLVLIS